MTRPSVRILLASGSTGLGLLLCYLVLEHRPLGNSVRFVDNRSQFEAMIEADRVADSDTPGSEVPSSALGKGTPLPPLVRRAMTEERAKMLFGALRVAANVYNKDTYYWNAPHLNYRRRFPEHPEGEWRIKTNSDGFRKSQELQEGQPDIRVLFAGDSHTGGVVPERENMAQVLERNLSMGMPGKRIEALNGGHGGFTYYQYLGTLERFAYLKPDVFVVVGFAGNDFREAVRLYRYHNSRPPLEANHELPKNARQRIKQVRAEILSQDLMQLIEFAECESRVWVAELCTRQLMTEIKRQCDEAGIRLIYVQIPLSMDVQPQVLGEFTQPILDICQLTPEELSCSNRLVDRVLGFLETIGVEAIDMRPAYAASEVPCYWESDFHINTEGHRLIGQAVAQRLLAK